MVGLITLPTSLQNIVLRDTKYLATHRRRRRLREMDLLPSGIVMMRRGPWEEKEAKRQEANLLVPERTANATTLPCTILTTSSRLPNRPSGHSHHLPCLVTGK